MKHPARVAQGGSSWLSLLGMASGGSLTGLRGLYWNASRGPSEFPALARHTPPRSSRPHAAGHGRLPSLCRRPARRALQRLGHLQRRRGPSHGATPAVERDGPQPHALVAAGGGRRGPPLRRPGRAVDLLHSGSRRATTSRPIVRNASPHLNPRTTRDTRHRLPPTAHAISAWLSNRTSASHRRQTSPRWSRPRPRPPPPPSAGPAAPDGFLPSLRRPRLQGFMGLHRQRPEGGEPFKRAWRRRRTGGGTDRREGLPAAGSPASRPLDVGRLHPHPPLHP